MKSLSLTTLAMLMASVSAFAFELNAKSAYVFHPATGTVLVNQNADAPMGPASLTKMLTLYIVFENMKAGKITPDTLVPVSEKAWRTGGSKMFIEVGKQIRVEDLIRGIAIVSGNDACIAIAEYLGGTEEGFAELMNTTAQKLGMTNSHFVNSNGLPDPKEYSTAHDLALLLTAIFRDFPEYKKYMAEEEFTFNGIKQQNRNGLLHTDLGIDAGKTGHTEEAGYHLAATAEKNGDRLVSVVMGTTGFSEREGETAKAFRTLFSLYSTQTLYKPGDVIAQNVPIWHGNIGSTNLTVLEPVQAYVSKAEASKIKAQAVFNKPLVAPLAADKPVGELHITMPSGQTITAGLGVQKPVEAGGFITKFTQTLAYKLGFTKF